MKNLIIFTTYARNLGERDKGLFPKANTLKEEKNGISIYKNDSNSLFATECLNKEGSKNIDASSKEVFIKSLFKEIVDSVGEQIEKVEKVCLFAHGFDLNKSNVADLAPIIEHNLLKDLSWLKEILKTEKNVVAFAPLQRTRENTIEVFFTAFSHEQHIITRLLNGSKIQLSENGIISEQLAQFAKILQTEWDVEGILNKGWIRDPMPQILETFNCKLFFCSNGKISDKKPDDFLWGEICQQFNEKNNDKSQKVINVVFTPFHAIAEYQDNTFYQKVIDRFHPDEDKFKDKDNHIKCPILFVGYQDIMNQKSKDIDDLTNIQPDRRYRFLDSSIWYRYAAIVGDFGKNLEIALDTFNWAYKNNLYAKNVCQEFLGFQNRLVKNSFLEPTLGSGHALRVFPFTFHSETKMMTEAGRVLEKMKEKKLRWNFLLVDDFANLKLKEADIIQEELSGGTKKEIVKNLIELETSSTKTENRIINEFEIALSPNDAAEVLGIVNNEKSKKPISDSTDQEVTHDIILLDYLFSHPEGNREFGTKLLELIDTATERRGLGVLQSYWIYPITVFNEAIQSDMQENGYQYLEEFWHFVKGADPLNTPELFRRTLFDFMDAQSKKVLFEERELWEFLTKHQLTSSSNSENKNIKMNAVLAFRQFIERFSVDEGLPKDSALGKSVDIYLKGENQVKKLRDHIRQLLYLLGFSTGFDFPVIEREFMAIENAFINSKVFENSTEQRVTKLDKKEVDETLKKLAVIIYSISGKYF